MTEQGPGTAIPRTLLITDRYLPEVGGTVTWFQNVYRRYPPGTVWIVTPGDAAAQARDRAVDHPCVARVRPQPRGSLRGETLVLRLLLRSLYTAVRYRVTSVHAGRSVPEGLVAIGLRKILGIPDPLYALGEDITVYGKNPRLRRLMIAAYRNAAGVIADSRYTRDLVCELGIDPSRVAFVPPGVDGEVFQPATPSTALRGLYDVDDKFVLLTVGRLVRHKGHDRVIDALPLIRARVPNLVYLIAGDGDEEPVLRRLARERGVAGAVRFLGRVLADELPLVYNLADIVIMANRDTDRGDVEGFGIVFLEAGACAKPVIAGASGGTGDAVRNGITGFRIDGTSVDEIARAVVALARDPARRRAMGEAGRRIVLAEHGWDDVVAKTIALSRATPPAGPEA